MAQGWFAMAVHALVLLAGSPDGACSGFLAGSINTHAAFLRRVLARLRAAGIVVAREGHAGGYALARPAERITLGAVYRAVAEAPALRPNPAAPNPACPISVAMGPVFAEVAQTAEAALVARLDRETVADVAARVRAAEAPATARNG